MKVSSKKDYYHGSPVRIEAFNCDFLTKGTLRLGAGFYFTNQISDALTYTGTEQKEANLGLEINPTLHTVKLDMKNPLPLDQEGYLSVEKVKAIMMSLPDDVLHEKLWDYGDVGSYGVDKVLKQAANLYAGDVNLTRRLFDFASEMFDDHLELFNRAVHRELGFDGIINNDNGGAVHICAWFPKQITITRRTPACEARLEDTPEP